MLTIADRFSLTRLALAPVLLAVAWAGAEMLFLPILALALLTDFMDGLLARKLHQQSDWGPRLDTAADAALLMTLPFCAWWLWPDVTHREAPFIVVAVLMFLIPSVLGLVKYGRPTCYHTWSAKFSTAFLGGSALLMFMLGPAWPFRLAVAVYALAAAEETAITLVLPRWRPNVPSIRSACNLRRSMTATPHARPGKGTKA